MTSLASQSPTTERNWRGEPFAAASAYLAALLVVYLPLEPAALALVPGSAYWVFRLLPDGLIGLLAATAFVMDWGMPRRARVLLAVLAAATLSLLFVNAARGFGAADSVNALRLLLRYVPLGVLLWAYAPKLPGIGRLLVASLLLSGAVQVAAGFLQLILKLWTVIATGHRLTAEAVLLVDGATGRYDRFGLWMMATVFVLLAHSGSAHPRPWRYLLATAALLMLFASTSRQAMVALAIAAALLLIVPGIRPTARGLAALTLVATIVMFAFVPRTAVVPAGDVDPQLGSMPAPVISTRGSTAISLDPNKNFRLYLALRVIPWAAATEPLVGFGPRQHVAEETDPRLRVFVEDSGIEWRRARHFTNDSNYAAMVIQFGPMFAVGFLGLLGIPLLLVARFGLKTLSSFHLFAAGYAIATALAAFLGPTLEIRATSLVLWTFLFAALGSRSEIPA